MIKISNKIKKLYLVARCLTTPLKVVKAGLEKDLIGLIENNPGEVFSVFDDNPTYGGAKDVLVAGLLQQAWEYGPAAASLYAVTGAQRLRCAPPRKSAAFFSE